MLRNKTVAVVVPAYNEEKQIIRVLEVMPDFVDRIVVVNDKSTDNTAQVVMGYIEATRSEGGSPLSVTEKQTVAADDMYNEASRKLEHLNALELSRMKPSQVANQCPECDRIILINHLENGGVGAAIARGYKWCKDNRIDCTAVMAGDGQMDPAELEGICLPVITDGVDYVKGNRLIHRSAWLVIPKVRYVGNSLLSLLTKIASGYWHISDTQTGYTAISLKALDAIHMDRIYPSYGMPNDMLVKLNIAFCTIREVEIKPVYRVGEKSKMVIKKVIFKIAGLLFRSFFKRLYIKYFFRDFHPLFILYHLSFLLGLLLLPVSFSLLERTLNGAPYPSSQLVLFAVLFIGGFQSLIFAMWMDIMDNERLHK